MVKNNFHYKEKGLLSNRLGLALGTTVAGAAIYLMSLVHYEPLPRIDLNQLTTPGYSATTQTNPTQPRSSKPSNLEK